MAGFYERLGLTPDSDTEELVQAYHRRLAVLVKKLRKAKSATADTSALEADRHALMEAYSIISDPVRKRRYDHYLRVEGQELPSDPNEFWQLVQGGMVEPSASAALDVVRSITSLQVGDSLCHNGSSPAATNEVAQPLSDYPALPDVQGVVQPDVPSEPMFAFENEAIESTESQVGPLFDASASTHVANENTATRFETTASRLLKASSLKAAVEKGIASVSSFSIPDAIAAAKQGVTGKAKPVAGPELERLQSELGLDGRYIASVREAMGITIDQVAESTRISSRYLQAIETNAFDRLPSAIFVKGYLREISRVLDLDSDQLVEGYLSLYKRSRG